MNLDTVANRRDSISNGNLPRPLSLPSFNSGLHKPPESSCGESTENHAAQGPRLSSTLKYTVLSIGDDEALLNTRQMVLEMAGYQVRSISSFGIIEDSEVQRVDLALLCHSIQEDRAAVIARFLQETNPTISIAQLCGAFKREGSCATPIIARDPEELLSAIKATLRDRQGLRVSEAPTLDVFSDI